MPTNILNQVLITMKNRIYMFILLMPFLAAGGCDSLFSKGDVEKVYDGPDQVAFFPLEDNNRVTQSNTSTTLEIQYIATDELATSTELAFTSTGSSTAIEGEHYTFGTPSPVTLAAGSWSTDIVVNFIVSTITEVSTAVDSNLTVPGSYDGVTATGGSPTEAAVFDVSIAPYGEIMDVAADTSADLLRVPGTYTDVQATSTLGGSGAAFTVVIGATGTVDSLGVESMGTGYFAPDTLIIPASEVGGLGADIELYVAEVSEITAPTLTIVDGGYGYTMGDNLTIPAASIGGAADLSLSIVNLSGSWVRDGTDEVLLQLRLDGGTGVQVAANMDTTNVYMYY